MAKRGFLRRLTDKITQPVKSAVQRVTAPIRKKPSAPKPAKKRTPTPKPKPSPAVAREQLMQKYESMYFLQRKYDAASTSRRIDRMTDAQVYAALDMTENDLETAVRTKPTDEQRWAAPDDPTSNILWYHGENVG